MAKGNGLNIFAVSFIVGILVLAGGVSAATNVSSCQVINQSGSYVLNTSILNSSITGACINITASNVIFDGAGYTIDGTDTANTYGVYVYNSTALTNVTVKNLNVTDFGYGIYYKNAQNGTITNNTANSNNYGIILFSSSNNNITDNTANSNTVGIDLIYSSNNNLANNTAKENL